MTLEEIEITLPNGFHDAVISEIIRDYKNATVRMRIEVSIDLPPDTSDDTDCYKGAELLFKDTSLFLIEPPDAESAFKHPGDIWFRFSRTEKDELPEALVSALPHGTLCYSFFILDWWSHIHIAAADVLFTWES